MCMNRVEKRTFLPFCTFTYYLFHRGRHVVTFDGARRLSSGNTLTLSCAGSANNCGCVDVTGSISSPNAMGCSTAGSAEDSASTSAEFDSSECLVQATVGLKTLTGGGETVVNGGGTLSFSDGGQYFLPSAVAAEVEVMREAEVVWPQWAAQLVGAVNVSSGGVLWVAGDVAYKHKFLSRPKLDVVNVYGVSPLALSLCLSLKHHFETFDERLPLPGFQATLAHHRRLLPFRPPCLCLALLPMS